MRAVVQKSLECRVVVDGSTVASAGPGLVALVGFQKGDGSETAAKAAVKIANMRIFPDEAGRMNLSLVDTGGTACVVPNFTVAGSTKKGHRPSFDPALEPGAAENLFELLCQNLEEAGVPVAKGVFRAHMHVHLINDGPVTIVLEIK